MKLSITKIAHHRNGIDGMPFHAVIFRDDTERKSAKLGVVFESPRHVAVFDIAKLADCDVEFGSNSYRGDRYEPALRQAITDHHAAKEAINNATTPDDRKSVPDTAQPPTRLIELTEDEFDAQYPLHRNHLNPNATWGFADDGGCLFETYGEELRFVLAQDPSTIWTFLDGDDGQYVVSGYHLVNRIGYLVSTIAVPDGVEIQVHIPNPSDE
jgi:hypothetical protein